MINLTIASLFDGIGGFPYAASLFGIKPVWASEILPEAVAVTRRHFPSMIHVGDITKLSGELLPPVDIISFGSPCQDLSQANSNRLGLAGERSGLFKHAIRIIKEMRKSTNGEYPRYAIWENVPGAFSSGKPKGADFRAVLEAFTDTQIPMPESNRWANAGMVRSVNVDFAWVVYNAADFRLAQRRRRIFALADFRGASAGEILLVPKSLSWHPAPCGKAGQNAPAAVGSGVETAGVGINGDIAGTLDANYRKGTGMRCGVEREVVLCAATGQSNAEILENQSSTLNCNCEQPIIYKEQKNANGFDGYNAALTGELSATLGVNCGMSTGRNGVIEVLNDQGGSSLNIEQSDQSPTLRHSTHGNLPIICAATVQPNAEICDNLCPTITRAAGESGNNKPYVVHPQLAGTLCGSAAGLSRPAGMVSETDLTIAYCLQDNMIGRDDRNGPAGGGVNEEICFTLNATDHHAVAVDCRNLKENELSGTLQSKSSSGYSLNYQNPVRVAKTCGNNSYGGWSEETATLTSSGGDGGGGSENIVVKPPPPYIVRRLTPRECERLMGFPDDWTMFGEDGKQISDSKRYSMLGNSVAVPCVAYIMQGIINNYEKENENGG
jgi:DNA (cytosine-5)-methyltransferase 1